MKKRSGVDMHSYIQTAQAFDGLIYKPSPPAISHSRIASQMIDRESFTLLPMQGELVFADETVEGQVLRTGKFTTLGTTADYVNQWLKGLLTYALTLFLHIETFN